jgi:hypothetical protein
LALLDRREGVGDRFGFQPPFYRARERAVIWHIHRRTHVWTQTRQDWVIWDNTAIVAYEGYADHSRCADKIGKRLAV